MAEGANRQVFQAFWRFCPIGNREGGRPRPNGQGMRGSLPIPGQTWPEEAGAGHKPVFKSAWKRTDLSRFAHLVVWRGDDVVTGLEGAGPCGARRAQGGGRVVPSAQVGGESFPTPADREYGNDAHRVSTMVLARSCWICRSAARREPQVSQARWGHPRVCLDCSSIAGFFLAAVMACLSTSERCGFGRFPAARWDSEPHPHAGCAQADHFVEPLTPPCVNP